MKGVGWGCDVGVMGGKVRDESEWVQCGKEGLRAKSLGGHLHELIWQR